jgi:hypothetical protein
MVDKLSIQNEMACFDRKDRNFYDSLTDEERRKFSNYLMIRWGSSVTGSRELQEFYVIATNERLNRNFFAVNQHPRLQWLMATSVSPGLGTPDHVWIAPKKKETGSNEVKKMLLDLYPTMKISDIETLAGLVDKKELREYLREHGSPD